MKWVELANKAYMEYNPPSTSHCNNEIDYYNIYSNIIDRYEGIMKHLDDVKRGVEGVIIKYNPIVSEIISPVINYEQEVIRLSQELKNIKEECAILKKTISILSK